MNSKLKFVTTGGDYDDSGCKKSFCSFSVAGTATWNDDVLIEILLRLPAKSLTRFKLVCKHWLSLISNHQFRHLHTLRHPKREPSLILRAHTSQLPTSQFFYFHPLLNSPEPIPYSFSIPILKILCSCNGLLLLQSDDPEPDYYVYNPTTKESRKISLTNSNEYKNVLGLHLAFDPSKSLHYKILCVRSASMLRSSFRIEVYDSESCIWKLRVEPFTDSMRTDFYSGVYWKKVVLQHWDCGNAACSCQLDESNDHLRHFIKASNLGDKSTAVYHVHGDYNHWIMNCHVRLSQAPDRFGTSSFIRGDDEQPRIWMSRVPAIACRRLFKNSSEKLIDSTHEPVYQERPIRFDAKDVFQFGESLAPV